MGILAIITQGCGLGLNVSVSRRSRDVPTSRLGLVSRKIVNVSVSSRSREADVSVSSRSREADVSVSSRSRPFTSRAQDRFSATKLCRCPVNTWTTVTFADIKQQYSLYLSDEEVSGRGLDVPNDKRFSALRPLGRKIFNVSASSAASEWVFSRAGLIMHPTRSRLSKANLSKLVFLNCNDKLQSRTNYISVARLLVCTV